MHELFSSCFMLNSNHHPIVTRSWGSHQRVSFRFSYESIPTNSIFRGGGASTNPSCFELQGFGCPQLGHAMLFPPEITVVTVFCGTGDGARSGRRGWRGGTAITRPAGPPVECSWGQLGWDCALKTGVELAVFEPPKETIFFGSCGIWISFIP